MFNSAAMTTTSIKVGTSFGSFEELERAIDYLIKEGITPSGDSILKLGVNTTKDVKRREADRLRVGDEWKYAFISYR